MEEIKPIAGYEGLYSVSNEGHIYAEAKEFKMYRGGIRYSPRRKLKPGFEGRYLFVVLQNKGKGKHMKVHRLVAMAFVENPLNKPIVNHKDGDKTNNRADNLEWATHSENSQHAVDTGLRTYESSRGVLNCNNRISEAQVREIRESDLNGEQLAVKYGVHRSTINRIRKGETFKHV